MEKRNDQLTKQEAAIFFGITERTLERWVKQGKVPAGERFGRRMWWSRKACGIARRRLEAEFERGLDRQFMQLQAKVLNG